MRTRRTYRTCLYDSAMRYLRMLSNSIFAGAVAAAYLALLVLQLNPHLSLRATSTWWLAATILAGYGIHLAAIFYAIIVFRQLLTTESLSPGWFSVQLLASLVRRRVDGGGGADVAESARLPRRAR